jgi:hypothetical protein
MSALKKMVMRLDRRNKRTSRGYITYTPELIQILGEVSKRVSVSIVENERHSYANSNEIDIEIKLSLTLERDLL